MEISFPWKLIKFSLCYEGEQEENGENWKFPTIPASAFGSRKLQFSGHVFEILQQKFSACLLFSSRLTVVCYWRKLLMALEANFHMIRHPIREYFHYIFCTRKRNNNTKQSRAGRSIAERFCCMAVCKIATKPNFVSLPWKCNFVWNWKFWWDEVRVLKSLKRKVEEMCCWYKSDLEVTLYYWIESSGKFKKIQIFYSI